MDAEQYVEKLLDDILKIEARTTYDGDYGAIDTLLDFGEAVELADLSGRQKNLLQMIYVDGYKENKAAEILGIAKSTASFHKTRAIKKIAQIYAQWEELDDEIQQT